VQGGDRAAQPVVAGSVEDRLVEGVIGMRPVLDPVRRATATAMLAQLVDRVPEERGRVVQE
jgi:hypothetical protein